MLLLPTTPAAVLREIIPAAAALLPARMRTVESDCELLAISLQESNLHTRRQGGNGPARGLLQFEITGVRGVMAHAASQDAAKVVCSKLGVPFTAARIHARMEFNDVLCFAFGRLLLWTDPRPMPKVGDAEGGFVYYVRNWRPGAANTPEGYEKCRRRWLGHYPRAVEAVR